MRIEISRKSDAFLMEAVNENGNKIILDNSAAHGGSDAGFRPMQTLLAALGGCSSIDVISILKKQRIEQFEMNVTIDGERETGNDANLWKKVHAHFAFSSNVPNDKAERAVELSITKYCSVSKTLEAAGAEITFSVSIEKMKE